VEREPFRRASFRFASAESLALRRTIDAPAVLQTARVEIEAGLGRESHMRNGWMVFLLTVAEQIDQAAEALIAAGRNTPFQPAGSVCPW
jgi:hypothetical protein